MRETETSLNILPKARASRWRQMLLAGVASTALIAGVGATTFAAQDESVARNSASGTLSLDKRAVALPDFTELVQQVKPAVVSVKVTQEGSAQMMADNDFGNGGNPFEGTPFERFFKDFQNKGGGQWQFRQTPHRMQAQGSGFFISADGYIVTNNHVVENASEVKITTDDGQDYTAKVIGADKRTDVALLKVDADKKFPFVTLAKATPKIGEWVVAMGNPFGLGGTVTAGIVSAQGRDIGEGPYDDFIQIDAAVNRGNSGGPTFNLKGEVIGVNTAIFSPSGGSVGIAFDIPATTVESVVTQLQNKGSVERGWLGVQIQPVTQAIADSLGLKEAKGALIASPQSGSPAEKAGLKSGDVITAVGGEQVRDARDLAKRIAKTAPGTELPISILRNGSAETVRVKIAELKDNTAKRASNTSKTSSTQPLLGLEVAPASEVDGAGSAGLAVIAVEPGGAASELGLKAGDVILKAGNTELSTPADLEKALKQAKSAGRQHTLALVKTHSGERFVALPAAVG